MKTTDDLKGWWNALSDRLPHENVPLSCALPETQTPMGFNNEQRTKGDSYIDKSTVHTEPIHYREYIRVQEMRYNQGAQIHINLTHQRKQIADGAWAKASVQQITQTICKMNLTNTCSPKRSHSNALQ